ncbi:MAG: PP2C family protein-serine/threonine phosphatase [Ignavibacteria bacterium]|nr:PP2C family protein-serine/threonine phosphatase [Ignavibacteria bacterium]
MAQFETFDQYLNYSKEQAYSLFQDKKNLNIFKVFLTVFTFVCFITAAVNITTEESANFSLFLMILNFFVITGLRLIYKKAFSVSNIRRSIFVFVIAQLIVFLAYNVFYPADKEEKENLSSKNSGVSVQADSVKSESHGKKKKEIISGDKGDLTVSVDTDKNESLLKFFFMIGIFVLIFRFSRTEIIQLFLISLSLPLILMIFFKYEFTADNIVPNLIMGLMFFAIAYTSERKKQRVFFGQYDFFYKKNYENLRMKKELNYAREIQLSMLPENEATIGELEIAAVSIPASEVGGDYFDYFKISENEIGLFICDVSGHGVASGLLLSGLRSCMHLILEDSAKPKVVIEKLNRMIRKTQNRKMFVTAIFAVIDLGKSKCHLYNAGHLPLYKISGESKEIFKIKKHGIALGAMNEVEIAGMENEVVFDFNKNDKIILYTDGVNEAMNDKKSEYGLDNLEFYLNNNADRKASELLKGLIADVKKFTGNSDQRDDLTLMIVQRN